MISYYFSALKLIDWSRFPEIWMNVFLLYLLIDWLFQVPGHLDDCRLLYLIYSLIDWSRFLDIWMIVVFLINFTH